MMQSGNQLTAPLHGALVPPASPTRPGGGCGEEGPVPETGQDPQHDGASCGRE
jgi:hypothetical protein